MNLIKLVFTNRHGRKIFIDPEKIEYIREHFHLFDGYEYVLLTTAEGYTYFVREGDARKRINESRSKPII